MTDDNLTREFSSEDFKPLKDDDTGEAHTVEVHSASVVVPSGNTAPTAAPSSAPGSMPKADADEDEDDDTGESVIAASTDALAMTQPSSVDPEPEREHVEAPQPVRPAVGEPTYAQSTQFAQPVQAAQPAQQTQPERRGPRHAVQMPQMPDLRETNDDLDSEAAKSRNEFTTVYDILDAIEQTLGEAKPGLFSPNMVKIDRDQLTEQIEDLKKKLPVQLERASALMREAERRLSGAQTQASAIVASAQSRAADMIKEANEQAQFLAGQENVVALAQAKARATMDAAQAKADRLTQGADKYCTDVMESLDHQLDKLKQDVHAGLGVLYNRQQQAAQDYAAAQAGARQAQAEQNARGAMPSPSGEENQR